MTERGDALLTRAKRTKANWSITDLEQLYLQNDCVIRTGAKHNIAKHPEFPHLRATLPNHKGFGKGYVRAAVILIEEAERLKAERRETIR